MVIFTKSQLILQPPGIRPKNQVELHLQGVASKHVVAANQYTIRLVGVRGNSDPVDFNAYEFNFDVDPRTDCPAKMQELLRRFAQQHPLANPSLIDHQNNMALLVGVDRMYLQNLAFERGYC